REVGTSIEWQSLRGQEHIQGPAARSGHSLQGVHINMVQVWSFLSIYLDINEVFVHDPRSGFVLEAFAFHDMAPVTSGIANAN
ncbi:MAG: hypothetical protein H6Q26_3255, partial [Bacteroidetes bacterium]|nr:hypothetical protein [Bacteroidota bacterium]